jgi:RNA polymerase sigma-70 factor (ECF subfamily)
LFRASHISLRENTDEQLMVLICKGDRMAFEILYDRYFNKLVWFAQRFIYDLQQAEDAVQEVFMKIIEKPERFDGEKKFSSWVYTVTGNTCRNILRDTGNRSRILEEQVVHNMQQDTVQQHKLDYTLLRQTIRAAYNGLSEKEKNIFVLRFEQELSLKEIAEIMDIPEGSVKSGIYYLLKKFSTHLKPFHYGTTT